MGAWGPGNFDNDDALDLLAEAPDAEALEALFGKASADYSRTGEMDPGTSARVLAGAELVAAARGRAPDMLPDAAAALVEKLGKPDPALVEKAREAVSAALGGTELAKLWAGADDPAAWNRAVTGLVARLDGPEREAKLGKRKARTMSDCTCSFCGEPIALAELVDLRVRLPTDLPGIDRGIFAHEACLNERLDSRRLMQWWTTPEE